MQNSVNCWIFMNPGYIVMYALVDMRETHLDSLTLVWERAVEEGGDDGHEGINHITLQSSGREGRNEKENK